MQLILSIVGFIFVMGLAVLVHEIGHFVTARKFGVKCHEFAIGMGPILWKKRKGETLYTIRAIPIGGFVMMGMDESERDIIKEGAEIGLTLDQDGHVVNIHIQPEEGQIVATLISNTLDVANDLQMAVEVAGERHVYPVSREAWYVDSKADREQQIVPSDRRLEAKPKLQRLIIMAAGAIMNFILAYVLVLIVGVFLGEVVSSSVTLDAVEPGMPAYEAGLLAGDQLTAIDNVAITGLVQVRFPSDEAISIDFIRNGIESQIYVMPELRDESYVIGVSFSFEQEFERSFLGTFRYANAQWRNGAMMIFDTLRMLGTGEVGFDQMAGFVGIAQMTGQVAALGIFPLLIFSSLININLGIFNLLPLPALDGGHITFIIIEAIIGKPVSPKIQYRISMIGMILLLGLMVFVTFNDIVRIFS